MVYFLQINFLLMLQGLVLAENNNNNNNNNNHTKIV